MKKKSNEEVFQKENEEHEEEEKNQIEGKEEFIARGYREKNTIRVSIGWEERQMRRIIVIITYHLSCRNTLEKQAILVLDHLGQFCILHPLCNPHDRVPGMIVIQECLYQQQLKKKCNMRYHIIM